MFGRVFRLFPAGAAVELFDVWLSRFVLALALVFSAHAGAAGPAFTDEGFSDRGTFIVPNEWRVYTYSFVNQRQSGAIISVGTFRALAAASQGNFSDVILFDGDHKVVEFNELQIEALKTSRNVSEFLAKVERSHPEGRAYVEALREPMKLDRGTTFLTSPRKFEKLARLAREGRIITVAGNLIGPKTLKEVGRYLRGKHVDVGVVDISNAQSYFLGSSAGAKALIDNLNSLPFSEHGIVNFTDTHASPSQSRDNAYFRRYRITKDAMGWGYYSLPIDSFLSDMHAIESHHLEYVEFLRELHDTDADMNTYFRWTCRELFR